MSDPKSQRDLMPLWPVPNFCMLWGPLYIAGGRAQDRLPHSHAGTLLLGIFTLFPPPLPTLSVCEKLSS